MAAKIRETQVIVVGAGPVGLLLAGELRLGGADVVVLERLVEPTGESRASQLNARTMEIFDQRGLLGRLGELQSEGTGHFGGLPLDASGVASIHAGYWKTPQFRTEAMLQEWAAELGANIWRGDELRSLTVADDHVEAEVDTCEGRIRLRAAYLVGCDGENSTVRRLAGFEFPGTGVTRELIRADVAGIDIPDRRFHRFENGLAIAGKRGDGVTRVMFHQIGSEVTDRTTEPAFAEVVAGWALITGEDISGGTLIWADAFGNANRLVARYRQDRVLLAGDAAHLQLPAGGQALNLGLQEAANLGWKLAAHVRGSAPAELLDSYHDERHPVAARVLKNVAAQAQLLLGGPEFDAMRAILGELLEFPEVRTQMASMLSGLDVRYHVGPASGHPLLGARMPHCELKTASGPSSTTAALRKSGGMLLDLSTEAARHAELGTAVTKWADRVRRETVVAKPNGVLSGVDAVLIRPDGHVVWINDDTVKLQAALYRWFGAPEPADHSTFAPGVTHARQFSHSVERARTENLSGGKMGKLTNKTALVTGSSRGIGRGIAEALGREGALVAVHYQKNTDAAEQTVKSVIAAGGNAFSIQAELGIPGDVDALFAGLQTGLKKHAGKIELNILVNNAGIMGGVAPEEVTPELFDRLVGVNAKAPLFIVQRALPIMSDGGRIINISSGLTRVANPQEIAYAMTKGAIEMITLHYARHLGSRGITINSVAPGVTNNGNPVFDIPEAREEMSQLSAFGRVGEPEDIGDVVAFLASDDARWVTGAFIDASGGSLLG